jgi:hypothetical protein
MLYHGDYIVIKIKKILNFIAELCCPSQEATVREPVYEKPLKKCFFRISQKCNV